MIKYKIAIFIINLGYVLAALMLIYFGIAASVWELHNPKANRMTFWTHFDDAIHFRSVEEFQ